MSRVYLLTAAHPLPLCDRQAERESVVTVEGKAFAISFVRGFRVAEHIYYRHAVDRLGYFMLPWQYELEAEICETDLAHLKAYLTANSCSGETAELWSVWIGNDRSNELSHLCCRLEDLGLEILEQFLKPGLQGGLPRQCRLTITI